MNTDELLEQINERQKELTEENRKYYEDVLVYVRLSFDKSEHETEEVLAEILDHILMAQEEGRSAADVFGTNPKKYLHEMIGELPKMVTRKFTGLITMGLLYFLGTALALFSLVNIPIYYIFNVGALSQTFYMGTLSVIFVLSILIVFVFIYALNALLRWLCFRNISTGWELILFGLYGIASFGVFLGIFFLVPEFGPAVEVSLYVRLVVGILLYIAGRLIRNRI